MPDAATVAELHFLTIAEASAKIAAKELSPVEYAEALIRHTEAIGDKIDAYITPTPEVALEQARRAEEDIAQGRYRGPMHGIPFALKDIYETAGIPTTAHSRMLADYVPARDATTVAKLKEAGGVLMGKLATHEFAHGGPSLDLAWPPARNPWNLEHFSGGSSSGSGAAVAAGLVPGAMGSDTGGSIRGPAGLCGLFGFVPTYGLVSRAGVLANSTSFDHCGPLTWTVEDAAIMLQVLAGHDPRDPASVKVDIPDYRAALSKDLKGLKIGVVRHFFEEEENASDEQQHAMTAAIETFRRLGATIQDVRLRPFQEYFDVKVVIAETELFSTHLFDAIDRLDEFGWDMRARMLGGGLFTSIDYVSAQRLRRIMQEETNKVLQEVDLLLTLGPGPAPKLVDHKPVSFWTGAKNTTAFNTVAGATAAVCNGFSESGLPMSMLLAGRPFEDATVLKAAYAYEKATLWRKRRPKLDAGTPKPELKQKHFPPEKVECEPEVLAFVEAMMDRHGIHLSQQHLAELCECAPHVMAMAERIPKRFDRHVEGANVFAQPGTVLGWN